MKHSNTDAIYAEYPFLETLFPRKKVRTARVARFDEDFLAKTGFVQSDPVFGSCRKLYLLDKDGKILTRVGGWQYYLRHGTRFERVDQALYRIGHDKASRVCFAVFYPNQNNIETDNLGLAFYTLVLYRLPRNFKNAAEWRNDIVQRNQRVLQEQ